MRDAKALFFISTTATFICTEATAGERRDAGRVAGADSSLARLIKRGVPENPRSKCTRSRFAYCDQKEGNVHIHKSSP